MTPRGFCLAMGEASTILQPAAAELPFRAGLEFNRRTLDLNVQAFDLSDLRLVHAHTAASALFFTPDSSVPFYYHLPFPPPPLFHHHLHDYWSLHSQFLKPQPSQPPPKLDPRSFQQPDHVAIVNALSHSSVKPNSLLSRPYDASPKPSPDLYAKYVIASPAWLPPGWITEVQTRRTGTTAGTRDKYYKDPVSGRRFRSRTEVYHFLETGKGRVRKRYKRRIVNPDKTADTVFATTKTQSPVGRANLTDTGCQPVSSLSCSKVLDPYIVDEDTSHHTLSVAINIPPVKLKPPLLPLPPNTFSSSPPETSGNRLPAKKPKACLKPATTSRKRCPQDRPQKTTLKKKVRFESPTIDAECQGSKLRLWLQNPVGPGVTRNEHQAKKPEQRLEVMEATVTGNNTRPQDSGRCGPAGKEQHAGLKRGFSRRNTKVAMDDELYVLIQKPGLTSRQRARLVQKYKAKRAKKLLAILGRKICCQLLGLPAR